MPVAWQNEAETTDIERHPDDERTGREHSVDVKPSYGLTDEEIERMLEESIDLGEEDINHRLLINARNDADQLLTALRKQLMEYKELSDSGERERMEGLAAKLDAPEALPEIPEETAPAARLRVATITNFERIRAVKVSTRR